jgi:hypothetical protein
MAIVLNCQPGLANLESQEDNSGDYSDISDYSNSLPWVNLPHIHSRTDREGLVPARSPTAATWSLPAAEYNSR